MAGGLVSDPVPLGEIAALVVGHVLPVIGAEHIEVTFDVGAIFVGELVPLPP